MAGKQLNFVVILVLAAALAEIAEHQEAEKVSKFGAVTRVPFSIQMLIDDCNSMSIPSLKAEKGHGVRLKFLTYIRCGFFCQFLVSRQTKPERLPRVNAAGSQRSAMSPFCAAGNDLYCRCTPVQNSRPEFLVPAKAARRIARSPNWPSWYPAVTDV